ncbi:hypothetical protein AAFH68_23870 [Flavobacterium sp. CGRL1]
MNLIKEPKGVDFIIQSPPLTEQERKEISDFIASRKSKKNVAKKNCKRKNYDKKIEADHIRSVMDLRN